MRDEANSLQKARSLAATLAIAFFGIGALALLASNALQIALNVRSQQAEIASNQQRVAQDASKTVSNFFQGKFSSLETALEYANPVLADSVTRKNILESLLGLDPAFRQFALLDRQGRQLGQATRVSQSSAQFTLQFNGDLLSQTLDGQRYFSSVYIDDATSEPLVVIAIPVTNVLGDYQGSLAAEVNLKFMWDLVDQLKIGETGYAYVVDNQGNLLAFGDTARVLAGENVQQIGEVSEFVDNPTASADVSPGIASYQGLTGMTVVGTYVPLGFPQWAVVTELPTGEAYGPIYQSLAISVGIILVMAILAGLTGIIISRRLTVPLVDLTGTATRIAEGEIQLQATLGGTKEIIALATAFNSMTERLRETFTGLEKTVSERTAELVKANENNQRRAKQFQSIAQVARTITSTLDIDNLLTQITNVISREFGFYHVGIFLLDPTKQYAVLGASNSEGGQKMLQGGHRLKVGEKGLVGFVASTGRPRVALDTGVDAVFFNNPNLPNTRSEIALPLRAGEEIIGVLDVQSNEPEAFSREDINILSTLADQVSIAIQNARQNEETRNALAESEALSRQFVQTGWSQFTKRQNILGLQHTGAKSTLILDDKNSKLNGDTQKLRGRGSATSLPIKLRGEVIGTVDIRSADNRQWDQDEMDIIAAIIERAAIAMENSRLIDDAQRRAAREQAIGEMSANIGTYTDAEAILRTTVDEIGKKIGGARVVFEFNPQDEKRSKSE